MSRGCVGLLAVAGVACGAFAEPVEPYEVMVKDAGAALRAGPTERHYRVAQLPAGQLLRVVGREGSMVEVEFRVGAIVPADSAQATSDGKTVRLRMPQHLIAANASDPLEGSWKSLAGPEAVAGTVLTVRQALRSNGVTVAYLVDAPEGTRAYLAESDVARIDAKPAQPGEATQVAPERPGPATDAAPTSLLEPMSAPGAESGPAAVIDPGQTTPASAGPVVISQGNASEGATDPATGEGAASETAPPPPLSPEQLDEAYRNAREQGTFDEEIDALIAEHQRTLESIDQTPFTERLRGQIRQRIAYLETRRDFINGPARLAEERRGEPRISEALAEKTEGLAINQTFDMVGMLVTSRIYDGDRLPKLYRLKSDDALSRTIAYIRPDAAKGLADLLGKRVGIIGSVSRDERSSVDVVKVTRIAAIE
ncbi:MAG: hypothetical protein H6811_01925 [Phycisphaeraceae bacterium]|nr:hypothetical protein [Phycisphaeraceae bacterium]